MRWVHAPANCLFSLLLMLPLLCQVVRHVSHNRKQWWHCVRVRHWLFTFKPTHAPQKRNSYKQHEYQFCSAPLAFINNSHIACPSSGNGFNHSSTVVGNACRALTIAVVSMFVNASVQPVLLSSHHRTRNSVFICLRKPKSDRSHVVP